MDDVMQSNVDDLESAVIGRRIVSVTTEQVKTWGRYTEQVTIITLDNGKTVTLQDSDDCCAYTNLEGFLLEPNMVDHIITGVKAENDYSTWHIFADMGDVLKLDVAWSEGSGYYGYGFRINVKDAE